MVTVHNNMSSFIEGKIKKENAWNYYIKPKERWNALDSWEYCRNIGFPLNTMLEIDFPQASDPGLDARRIRKLTHYCRMAVKRGLGLEHYSMWSRHVARGSNIERDMLLISVPDDAYAWFKHTAENWKIPGVPGRVKVTRVGYDKCIERDGKFYTPFEVLTRNLHPVTRQAEPLTCYEPSEQIFKPILFYSLKVEKAIKQGKVPMVMIDE